MKQSAAIKKNFQKQAPPPGPAYFSLSFTLPTAAGPETTWPHLMCECCGLRPQRQRLSRKALSGPITLFGSFPSHNVQISFVLPKILMKTLLALGNK